MISPSFRSVLKTGTALFTATILMLPNAADAVPYDGGHYASLASVLTGLTTGTILSAHNAVFAAGSHAEYLRLLSTLAPAMPLSVILYMYQQAITNGLINSRLAALGSGTASGIATGNISDGVSMWGQVFGHTADQGIRDGIAGYNSSGAGFAFGIDNENLYENTVIGLALSYNDNNVKSKNANRTRSDVNTIQLTLYGDYDLDDRTYVSGQLSYGWSETDQTRHDLGGVAGLDASADYASHSFSTRAELGRDYGLSDIVITPKLSANWVHYITEDYTESGAGNAGLDVDNEAYNIFEIGLATDFSKTFENINGSRFTPRFTLGYRYDLIGDEIATTSTFLAGGAAFETEGAEPAQHSFDIGADITYYDTDSWEFNAGYNFEYKEDYAGHSGMIRATYHF